MAADGLMNFAGRYDTTWDCSCTRSYSEGEETAQG